MPMIRLQGTSYDCHDDETVLQCLTRHGVLIPSGCQSGVCQTCMLHAVQGQPPKVSQAGLKNTQVEQNYFLACVCKPSGDLEIALPGSSEKEISCLVREKEMLNPTVLRLRLEPESSFAYKAGQFINLIRPLDRLVRSYSLASLPSENLLELHIKCMPDGKMSGWIANDLHLGDEVFCSGPLGDCFYVPGKQDLPLLLVGVGTGLAPLHGVLKDALSNNHLGDIHVLHASLATEGLYMIDELRALDRQHGNVHYTPCVLHGEAPEGGLHGNVEMLVKQQFPDLKGWRVYVCGDPAIVSALKRNAYMAGAAMQDIYSDPFTAAA